MSRRSALVVSALFTLVAASALRSPAPATGQPRWSWPDKSENLTVLPKDTQGSDLRATMHEFTEGLGVRCDFCHVAGTEPGLEHFDFASDKNPNKDRAREMMRMMGGIEEHLARLQPTGGAPVAVTCNTCHRGQARPISLADSLVAVYDADGVDATVARYHELRDKFLLAGTYDFGEESLNQLGYHILLAGNAPAAVTVFQLNADQFPQSKNVYDSLGEAYAAAGDTAKAIANYEKAVAIEPRNRHAAQQLEELKK